MHRLSLLMLALLLALLPCAQALAVALGDEQILSRLGDPVEVEIEVLQWEDMDMARVQIGAASEQEYAAFGMTWLPVLENLNFNLLGPNLDGEVRLLVSSRDPLNEPFLELLLVLRWPGGSLLREYVLLFDPPGTPIPPPNVSQTPAPAAVPEPEVARAPEVIPAPAAVPEPAAIPEPELARAPEVVVPAPEVAPEPEATPEPEVSRVVEAIPEPAATPEPAAVPEPEVARAPEIVAEPAVSPQPAAAEQPDVRTQVAIEVDQVSVPAVPAPAPQTGTRRSYQVRSGDSLWNIARQFRPAGAGENLFQVLVSLHDLNRAAFINGNISLLKADAALQIPDATDIARIDASRAEALFNERWNQGTQPFDAALVANALPLFGGAEEADVLPAPEPAFTPLLPPGQELPPAVTAADDLIMVANVATPLQTGADTQQLPEAAPANVMPDQESAELLQQSTAATVATVGELPDSAAPETAVAGQSLLAPSAESLQQTMQTREQQRIALEQQVEAMRIRMQEAQTVAALFSSSLQQAQESRAAREQEYLRNSILLGTVVLALAAGFGVALVQVFRQASQLRAQRVAADIHAGSPAAPRTSAVAANAGQLRVEPGFHRSQQAAEDSIVARPSPAMKRMKPPAAADHYSPDDEELFAELENLRTGEPPRQPKP